MEPGDFSKIWVAPVSRVESCQQWLSINKPARPQNSLISSSFAVVVRCRSTSECTTKQKPTLAPSSSCRRQVAQRCLMTTCQHIENGIKVSIVHAFKLELSSVASTNRPSTSVGTALYDVAEHMLVNRKAESGHLGTSAKKPPIGRCWMTDASSSVADDHQTQFSVPEDEKAERHAMKTGQDLEIWWLQFVVAEIEVAE